MRHRLIASRTPAAFGRKSMAQARASTYTTLLSIAAHFEPAQTMTTPDTPNTTYWQQVGTAVSGPSARKILSELPYILAINVICTVLVTYVMRHNSSLLENWVFSNCIGFCCYGLIRAARILIWPNQNPRSLAFYLTCILLAPLGFFCGTLLAAYLYGYPVQNVLAMQWRYVQGFVILSGIVSTVAAWSLWNRIRITELTAAAEAEKARSAAIERQAVQAQLQVLQAQIEPHMLFNTLANLQGLIAIDPERAQHMLAQLITYLRATLSASRAESTTLQNEFSLLRAYLDLLAIRMGKRLQYQLDLPEELAQLSIPPMLLQPLAENAIKHGLEPKLEGGSLHISAVRHADTLELRVADTGLGLAFDYAERSASATDGHGLGNINIRERLQAIFGPQAAFRLGPNTPEGTLAVITLPLPTQAQA